jgi:hypothetical protein
MDDLVCARPLACHGRARTAVARKPGSADCRVGRVEPEATVAHRALEAMWECMFGVLEGARLERRSDPMIALCPSLPVPQFNGP